MCVLCLFVAALFANLPGHSSITSNELAPKNPTQDCLSVRKVLAKKTGRVPCCLAVFSGLFVTLLGKSCNPIYPHDVVDYGI